MILEKVKTQSFISNIQDIIHSFDFRYLSDDLPKLDSSICPAKSKLKSLVRLIKKSSLESEFLNWLKISEGDDGRCNSPYLFASILFNYHTQTSAKFIEDSFSRSKRRAWDRNEYQFAFDLVSGWIPELIINLLLNDCGVIKQGSDADYVLKKSFVTSESDFIFKGHSIELMTDSSGFLWNKDRLDFRGFKDGSTKWLKMLEEDAWLLVLCAKELKYFLYHTHHLRDVLDFKIMHERHPVYSCNTWSLSTGWKNRLESFDLNKENLTKHLQYIEFGKL